MFVELHMLQNFAPSNLNRDDTGAPKDCEFGGYRRARISSQCIKRAIRECFKNNGLLEQNQLADRTKILVSKVVDALKENGKDEEQSRAIVAAALGGAGLTIKDDGKSEYLLFMGRKAIEALSGVCQEHWDTLAGIVPDSDTEDTSRKKKKKSAKAAVPKEVSSAILDILDGDKAADLALFGRMLADLPKQNVDAASQVAHAISTNRVSMEHDFYTAVDDLQPEEETAAGMMGTVEFNSSCFYRYSNVSLAQLKKNLGDDEELARKTVEAFLRASKDAIPTGKQNSFAAHNPPDFIMAVVRKGSAPLSLANAFVKPIRPSGDNSLVEKSIAAVVDYREQLRNAYGTDGVTDSWFTKVPPKPESLDSLGRQVTFDELVAEVLNNLDFE